MSVADGAPNAAPSGAHRAELPAAEEPTLGRLVADASGQLSTLLRSEIALAKSELKVSVTAGGIGAALLAVAGFLVALAVIMGSIAAAYGLAYVVPYWLAFLIVFGAYLLIALVLALLAVRRFKKVSAPERTIETSKQTLAILSRR